MENNIINQIAVRDQERLRGYKDLLDFYQGRQWPGRERWGERRLTFNYARVFIDKITSYLMSGINFTVESADDTREARTRAEQAEKMLARVYEENNLEQLDFETEIDCAVLGDACYKVTYFPDSGIKVTSPDIQGIQAWWRGDDVSRVWRVASRYQLSAEEFDLLYGKLKNPGTRRVPAILFDKGRSLDSEAAKCFSNNPPFVKGEYKLVTVVEVWTDTEFELYLDGRLIEKKANPYGFIPFIIFPNLREPKKFWGASDLSQIMEPQRELNRAMSQISHILELSGNPVAVLENVEESTDIAVKPGAVWNIPEDAKAYLLDLLQGGGLKLHIDYIDLLYRVLHDTAEMPRAAFGGGDRDLSGVAMEIELYPLLQKVLRKRAVRTAVYNRRSRMILKLLEKFQPSLLRTPGSTLQTLSSDPFLTGDPTSSLQTRVVWGQVFPEDKARLVDSEKILVESGIHSRRRAMDEVGVKDPEAEFKHWLEEEKEILNMSPPHSSIPSPSTGEGESLP